MIESTLFNLCDGVRYCDPLQGFTTTESTSLDDVNRRMEDDFRGIFRGLLIMEAMISVYGVDVKSGMSSVGK